MLRKDLSTAAAALTDRAGDLKACSDAMHRAGHSACAMTLKAAALDYQRAAERIEKETLLDTDAEKFEPVQVIPVGLFHELLDALDLATATVELDTGNGAQSQPWPRGRDKRHVIDRDAISLHCRKVIRAGRKAVI